MTRNLDFKVTIRQITRKWYKIELYLHLQTNIKVLYDLSNGAIFNDLERPLAGISRSRRYLTVNIPETLRDTYTYDLLKGVISNDLEWLSGIFNDTKRRAVSLRQLSYLYAVLGRSVRCIWQYLSLARLKGQICVFARRRRSVRRPSVVLSRKLSNVTLVGMIADSVQSVATSRSSQTLSEAGTALCPFLGCTIDPPPERYPLLQRQHGKRLVI